MKRQQGVSQVATVALIAMVFITGFTAYYLYSQTETSQLQNKVQSLQTEVSSLLTNITSLSSEVDSLKQMNTFLGMQLSTLARQLNLNSIEVLVKNEVVTEQPGGEHLWSFNASYSGYVVVVVNDSDSDANYVNVTWQAKGIGVSFNSTASVGHSGNASFPVLPSRQTSGAPCAQAACLVPSQVVITLVNGGLQQSVSR